MREGEGFQFSGSVLLRVLFGFKFLFLKLACTKEEQCGW